MARVLVTGAAGFVGSNLSLALEKLGHEVTAVDHFVPGVKENLVGFKGRLVEADVRQGLPMSERYECVFHNGDITDPRYPDPRQVLEGNLGALTQLISFCKKRGARLIYASSAGVYGNGPTPMREDQPEDLQTPYAESKWKMDSLVMETKSTLPIVGLRYFNVFGPREAHKKNSASMVYHCAKQLLESGVVRLFKYGEQARDFVYVEDVVAANLCAMHADSGVYNVGTGVATPFRELASTIAESLEIPCQVDYIDMPFDPKTYQANTQADLSLSRQKLGFEPRWPFRRAVKDYMHWLRGTSLVLLFLLFSISFVSSGSAWAGVVDSISGLDLVSGKQVSWGKRTSKKDLVLVFLSARCPCSASHEASLKELSIQYPGTQFIGIHSNKDEPDSEIQSHFTEAKLPFSVISDRNQEWANLLGALKTPHVFLIDQKGEVQYSGAIDDSTESNRAEKPFLKIALNQLGQGKKPDPEKTRPLGCPINR